jgi:hypothetical protein
MYGGSSRTALIVTLVLLLSAGQATGEEPPAYQFDVPIQTLSSALNEFALQSHQQILFAPDVATQKRSTPLHGDMQPLAALKLLLKGSGLTFKTTPNGAILIGNPSALRVVAASAPASQVSHGTNQSDPDASLATITVQSARERDLVRRQIRHYVSAITVPSYEVSLGRWEKREPLCPLVAGLSNDDAEYLLTRLSHIAATAGAPLAPEHCNANFYVIVTSEPEELIKAWNERDPWLFDDDADEGGTKIRRFLDASTPVRVWYNVSFSDLEGLPLRWQFKNGVSGRQGFFAGGLRDLSSVILIVDARLTKGVSFGQLAGYLAMVGLAQIRLDAKLGDAPTILQAFSDPDKAPLTGLSSWDQAYLKALYHTDRSDKTQRLAIARSIGRELVP